MNVLAAVYYYKKEALYIVYIINISLCYMYFHQIDIYSLLYLLLVRRIEKHFTRKQGKLAQVLQISE